jgi:hypothetical protein
VAKVFVEKAELPKTYQLSIDHWNLANGMDTVANSILDSLKTESLPSETPLKTPAATMESLVAKTPSLTDQGRTTASAALQTARAVIDTMRSGGSEETDELLMAMVAREKKLAADAKKLEDKSPSRELRLATVSDLKATFVRNMQAQADGRSTGATKAALRAQERLKQAEELVTKAKALRQLAEEANDNLSLAHVTRAAEKTRHADEVVMLFEAKIAEIEAEDITIINAETEQEAETPTESERDEAIRLTGLLQQQLAQLQKESAKFVQQQGAQDSSDPSTAAASEDGNAEQAGVDLWRTFTAGPELLPVIQGDPSEAEKKWLAKLHALFVALPWGQTLPAVQFKTLGAPPQFVHTLVGTAMWEDCWKDGHATISVDRFVPFQLLNTLKVVIDNRKITCTDEELNTGKTHYGAIINQRAKLSSPYM